MLEIILLAALGGSTLLTSLAASFALLRRNESAWTLVFVTGCLSFWFFLAAEFPPHGLIVSALMIVVAVIIREPQESSDWLDETGTYPWRR